MKNTKMRNTFRIVLHNPVMQILYIANRKRNRYYIYNEFVHNTISYFKQVNRRVGLSPGKHTKKILLSSRLTVTERQAIARTKKAKRRRIDLKAKKWVSKTKSFSLFFIRFYALIMILHMCVWKYRTLPTNSRWGLIHWFYQTVVTNN